MTGELCIFAGVKGDPGAKKWALKSLSSDTNQRSGLFPHYDHNSILTTEVTEWQVELHVAVDQCLFTRFVKPKI